MSAGTYIETSVGCSGCGKRMMPNEEQQELMIAGYMPAHWWCHKSCAYARPSLGANDELFWIAQTTKWFQNDNGTIRTTVGNWTAVISPYVEKHTIGLQYNEMKPRRRRVPGISSTLAKAKARALLILWDIIKVERQSVDAEAKQWMLQRLPVRML